MVQGPNGVRMGPNEQGTALGKMCGARVAAAVALAQRRRPSRPQPQPLHHFRHFARRPEPPLPRPRRSRDPSEVGPLLLYTLPASFAAGSAQTTPWPWLKAGPHRFPRAEAPGLPCSRRRCAVAATCTPRSRPAPAAASPYHVPQRRPPVCAGPGGQVSPRGEACSLQRGVCVRSPAAAAGWSPNAPHPPPHLSQRPGVRQ